jgi:hypothetical protein
VGGLKSYDLGKAFKVQSSTKRKQVQYALKKLGFYSKNVDGLWGSGTKKAIESYATSNNLMYERPEKIFRDITRSVNVPTSFASARSTKSNKKPKSSGESNLLKLLVIGGICATTPDPSACLASAAGSVSKSKRPDYSSINDGKGGASGNNSRIIGGSGTSFQRIGNTTFGSDGTIYNQIGNTTFGSDGTTYQNIGDTTFRSDGTIYNQIGNTTFGSDGTTYQSIGNSVFGSDGTTCTTIGTSSFCN